MDRDERRKRTEVYKTVTESQTSFVFFPEAISSDVVAGDLHTDNRHACAYISPKCIL